MINVRNKLKYFFDNYLVLIILLFGFLTLITYSISGLEATSTGGIIYRGVLAGVAVILFLLGMFAYRHKPPLYLIICVALYIVSNILTIFVSPVIKQINIVPIDSLQGVALVFINAMTVFVYLYMMKLYIPNKRVLNISCMIMILFGLFLAIYSYCSQYEAIANTFTKEYGWNYDVTSIFKMKTEYGYMLFICSLFAILLANNTKKYILYIFPIFFLVNMFISRSKTSILCLSIVLLCLLIYHIHNSWNEYKKKWIISFSIVGSIFIVILVLTLCNVGIFEKLNFFISQVIFNDAKVVLEDRFNKWGQLFSAVNNPLAVICGYGERIAARILSSVGAGGLGDGIYVSNYGNGGVVKFVLYLALAIMVIVYNFKSIKDNWKRFVCLSIELSILIGGLFEDDNIIGMTYNSLFPALIFYCTSKVLFIDKEKMA